MSLRRAQKNRARKRLKRQAARNQRGMQSRIGEVDHAQMRLFVLRRDDYRCHYCRNGGKLTLDHVVPQSRGGADHPTNLVACCRSCNDAKANKSPKEWAVYLGTLQPREESAT